MKDWLIPLSIGITQLFFGLIYGFEGKHEDLSGFLFWTVISSLYLIGFALEEKKKVKS